MVTYWGKAPPADPLYAQLRFSAHMNTIASTLSGLSAFCMGMRSERGAIERSRARQGRALRKTARGCVPAAGGY